MPLIVYDARGPIQLPLLDHRIPSLLGGRRIQVPTHQQYLLGPEMLGDQECPIAIGETPEVVHVAEGPALDGGNYGPGHPRDIFFQEGDVVPMGMNECQGPLGIGLDVGLR